MENLIYHMGSHSVTYHPANLLFAIVMEALSREFRVALPRGMMYADDLVVTAESEDDLIKRLNEWKCKLNWGDAMDHIRWMKQIRDD